MVAAAAEEAVVLEAVAQVVKLIQLILASEPFVVLMVIVMRGNVCVVPAR